MIEHDPQDILLTEEELAYEQAIESGTYHASSDIGTAKQSHKARAKRMMKRIPLTIRPYQHDIELLKSIAMKEGIPYQTKLISIIHQYVASYGE